LLGGEVTFTLGASGHIAGVINPPARKRRNHWISDVPATDADDWFTHAESHPGSWWPHWADWLERRGAAMKPAPKGTGNARYPPLQPAPGSYVLEPAGPR
jgi:polyhydroxyalkanoate synthase